MHIPPFATYALLSLATFLFVGGFFVDRLPKRGLWLRVRSLSIVVQIAALVLAYFALRPGRGDSRQAITSSLAQARPVMLDFYSNY